MTPLKHTVAILGILLFLQSANSQLCKRRKALITCTATDEDVILQKGFTTISNQHEYTTNVTLTRCRIKTLATDVFKDDVSLKYIDLSVNKIETLDAVVFHGLTNLRHLNLSHNLITTLPQGLLDQNPNLVTIDLKSNKLNFIAPNTFATMPYLSHVDLSNNELSIEDMNSTNFNINARLKYLDLSQNNLEQTDDETHLHVSNVELLNLDSCSILYHVPPFAVKSPNTKHLILSHNKIREIDDPKTFSSLVNLETLNLADNNIYKLGEHTFTDLKKLKVVVLRNNILKALPDSLFTNVKSLANVDLSYNVIEYIPVNAFRGTSTKNLNLSHNRFSYLEANFCLELRNSGANLNKFYFNDNPWQCACLNEVVKEAKTLDLKYNSAKFNGENVVCVTTNTFTCKRQTSDNELFISMYERKDQKVN